MSGRNDIHWWGDKFRSAQGKTTGAILEQAKVVADALGEGITVREYAQEIERSKSAVDQYAQIGKDKRLSSITGQLPDAMMALYQCTQLTDEQLKQVAPHMTEAAVKNLRAPKEKERKVKPAKKSWRGIAQKFGILSSHPNSSETNAAKRKILAIDSGIEFGSRGLEPEMAERLQAVCVEIAESEGKTDQEFSDDVFSMLSLTVQQRVEAWKRTQQRILKKQIDWMASEKAYEMLEDLYPRWRMEAVHAKEVIDSHKGVFSYAEYKTVLGALHPDRAGQDDVLRKRLNKAFNMVKEKERLLCAPKPEKSGIGSLPKTVEELLAQRRKGK